MPKINIDGIEKIKRVKIHRIHYVKVSSVSLLGKTPRFSINYNILGAMFMQRRVALSSAVFALLIVFSLGMWVESHTQSTLAEGETPSVEGIQSVSQNQTDSSPDVSSNRFDGLTLKQIEGFFREAVKTPELKEAEVLAERKEKLKEFLQERNSPLAEISGSLAELQHWQMVLAISNSESSLGKRCSSNNCSGIGVEPGHPLWREYNSKAEWAKDLDRLIEKRYKNWTLKEMNGVYNKPGSANWVSASSQILEELQEKGIQ